MGSNSYIDIDLHLKEPKYLFLDPELNPFEERLLQVSGAEKAVTLLRTRKGKPVNITLNIFLPGEQIKPDLQNRTEDALSRYCDFKILQNQHQIEIQRAKGLRAVMIGLIFSAICILMVLMVQLKGKLNEMQLVVFAGFFTILIWMAIWTPAEAFLYGLPPIKREIQIYKILKNAEIVIKEEI